MKQLRILMSIFLLAAASAASGQPSSLDKFLRAVNEGDSKTVAALLSLGLDPDSADPQGDTVLMIASRLGHKDVVQVLIGRAHVTRISAHGDTALNFAALGGHLEIVKLLVENGAPVSVSTGWSPLHYAAFENRPAVIKYLLSKDAKKDALAPNGFTPLMLAARNGHLDAAIVLLYADADVGIKGPAGETALSIATARNNNEEMVRLLKRAGAVN
jgi:ankyrin repeat protein